MSSGLGIECTYLDDNYTFRYAGAELEMTRLRAKSDTITAEVRIRWTHPPYAGLLHGPAATNLLADRTLKTIANHCDDQIPAEFPWWKFLNEAKSKAVTRFREGDPLQNLAEVDLAERPRFLIPDLVEWDGATVMAAPGGSVKSFVALAAAAAVATGRAGFLGGIDPANTGTVVYLDWESNIFTHAERLAALCAPLGESVPTNLLYRREFLPLSQSAPDLARMVQKEGAVMVVIDSKGAASAIGGERDGTIEFYNAVRRLGVGALIVDHVNKAAAYGKQHLTAFGSIYTENLARRLWVAPRAVATDDGVAVLWQLTKVNNGKAGKQLGFHVLFDEDHDRLESVVIKQIQPSDPALMPQVEGVSIEEQLTSVMEYGESYSKSALAFKLGADPNSVKTALTRMKHRRLVDTTGGGTAIRWFRIPPVTTEADRPDPF